jgi:hypothetical protein
VTIEEIILGVVDKAGVATVAIYALHIQGKRHEAVELSLTSAGNAIRDLSQRIDDLVTRIVTPRLGGM